MQQLLREAQELGRRRAWDEALALLAQAEVLARQLDPDTLRSVTREQERQRAAQKEAQDATDRAQRLEQLLADGARLLEEGKATEAKVAFDEAALASIARNAARPRGRRCRGGPIASTTAPREGLARTRPSSTFPARGGPRALSDAAADPTFTRPAAARRDAEVLEGCASRRSCGRTSTRWPRGARR
jgi:hypothetical protein